MRLARVLRRLAASLLLSLTGHAGAVVVIEGSVQPAPYEAALAQRGDWFQRAVNICGSQKDCKRAVVMRFTVAPEGKVADCRLLDSDIRNPQTADLFCRVVRSTPFPAAPVPVVLEHHLGIIDTFEDDGRAHCPPALGERRGNPALVRHCLDDLLRVLNANFSSEQHRYGARPEDMTGSMHLRITIKPNGKVSDVDNVADSIKSWNFRRSILHLVEDIDFGPAEKRETYEVVFQVPFNGTRAP